MCLSAVTSNRKRVRHDVTCWKVIKKIHNIFCFEFSYRWNKPFVRFNTVMKADQKTITIDMGNSYISGFHTFVRKEDAIKWKNCDDLYVAECTILKGSTIQHGINQFGLDSLEVIVSSRIIIHEPEE